MRHLSQRSRRTDLPEPAHDTSHPLADLYRHMNDLFADFYRDFEDPARLPGRRPERPGFFPTPPVDVAETDDEIQVTADLPGLTEQDVSVTLDEDQLILHGEQRHEAEDRKKNYHLIERSFGEFTRRVALPAGVERDKVHAQFKNGVLTVTLPKTREAKSQKRAIPITAG